MATKPKSKPTVRVYEFVQDAQLKRREKDATRAVQRFSPGSKVRLRRTIDHQVVFSIEPMTGLAGDKKLLDNVYRAVMEAIGQARGRAPGVKRRQTKLNLPESAYRRLRELAEEKDESMSDVVAELVLA